MSELGGQMETSDDPITMVIIAGGIQAYGQIQEGKAAAAQAKSEQEILNYNAEIKEREATLEVERAQAEARRFKKEGEVLQGEQRVRLAKGGVLVTTGTPALLLEETARELEADRMSILKEGFLAESFALSEAEGLRFQGRAARARGINIRTASRYKAAGTILSGFGQASSLSSTGTAKTTVIKRPRPTTTTGGANIPTRTRRG